MRMKRSTDETRCTSYSYSTHDKEEIVLVERSEAQLNKAEQRTIKYCEKRGSRREISEEQSLHFNSSKGGALLVSRPGNLRAKPLDLLQD
jgi:hypothetical protein